MRAHGATTKLVRNMLLSSVAVLALQPGAGRAHTVSIGYTFSGPGAVTLWYGSYHASATFNEADVQLVGPSFNSIVAFTLRSGTKPAGLVDGTNNFYSNTAGTALVATPQFVVSIDGSGGSFNPATQSILNWQGATFTGLRPGTYTFTYNPLSVPTVEWHPIRTVIETNSFTLTAQDILGIAGFRFYGLNQNQIAVGTAMDVAINAGAFNQAFYNLALLPRPAMAQALTQLSGEAHTQSAVSGFRTADAFLSAMLDPWGSGMPGMSMRGGDFGASIPWWGGPIGNSQYGDGRYDSGGMSGNQQYGGSQYGDPRYGDPQYGGSQYGDQQYGDQQYGDPRYGDPQYGNPQYGNSQYGNSQYGDGRYGNPQYGAPYGGRRPDGRADQSQSCDIRRPASAQRLLDPCWSVWSTTYGGHSTSSGDAVIGSHDTTMRTVGIIGGVDYRLRPGTVLGAAIAGGTSNWNLHQGLGGGRSDAFQAGTYGSTRFGSLFLSAAFAYSWHDMTVNRTVSLNGGDALRGGFVGHNIGGRAEAGYRVAVPVANASPQDRGFGVTPYAALQAQSFTAPAYVETAVSGPGTFALNLDKRTTRNMRTEAGFWFDRSLAIPQSGQALMRARLAWVHNWMDDPAITANFQNLPGASFTVLGAKPAANAMLASLGLDFKFVHGLIAGVKVDGEFANKSQVYSGATTIRYQW